MGAQGDRIWGLQAAYFPPTATLTLCVISERNVARGADPDFDWPRALVMTRRPLALLYEA